ncbi:MAG: TonB-dependent receptor [Halioglobus sp.]
MKRYISALIPPLVVLYSATPLSHASELTEILVTAEFRDTPLQSQSASTSVLTGDNLQQRAAQDLKDALSSAPNVNFSSGSSRPRFFQIRGIGERSQFIEPLNASVGFVIDGVDYSGMGVPGTLFDVAQIEVLRGPQGTLHGANALAGLINVTTGEPQAEPELSVSATAAEYDTWDLGIVGAGPLIDDVLLYRMAVSNYQSDGFIDNAYLGTDDVNNRDETSIRGKLRWLVDADNTLDLSLSYADVDNGYDAFSLDNTRSTLSDQPGRDTLESTALSLSWNRATQAVDIEAQLSVASSELEYSYDVDWSFVGIAPDFEFSAFDSYARDRDSYSAQLRFSSAQDTTLFGHDNEWVAGLYYLGDREDLLRQYDFLAQDFSSRYDTDTFAAFGQLRTDLDHNLSLVSGLRVERRNTAYRDNNDVAADPGDTLWGGRLAVEYLSTESALIYASIARGYSANGVNAGILSSQGISGDPDIIASLSQLETFDSESLINYELGYKASYMEERLRVRLALFYMDRQDQQVGGSLVVPRDNGSTDFIDYTDNAAQGNNYGLELELEYQASDRLALYANLGLLETEFDDYINADEVDLSGRDQAQAPAYQYAVGGRVELGAGFYTRLDIEGKDEFFFSDRHEVKSPSYNLVNLRLGFEKDQWSLAVWARNLTDEDYFVRAFGTFGNDPRKEYALEPYYQYGDPRVIGFSANYSFF